MTGRIYAFTEPQYENTPWKGRFGQGLLKVGMTERERPDLTDRERVEERIWEQFGTNRPVAQPFKILVDKEAITVSGKPFTDKDVHRVLESWGAKKIITKDKKGGNKKTEWYETTQDEVLRAIAYLTLEVESGGPRLSFRMRPEQIACVQKTLSSFRSFEDEGRKPHMLWNAKMRFGKTFTTYQLAVRLQAENPDAPLRVLISTYKPAVRGEWRDQLLGHVDFEGWQFKDSNTPWGDLDQTKPIVAFVSYQDLLGKDQNGDTKVKNKFIFDTDWHLHAIDEYHYGAWRANARDLYGEGEASESLGPEAADVESLRIKAARYLYLSGTPFRALADGEFLEEQIFNWTYSDEQRAKQNWSSANGANPYLSLPEVQIMTYVLPEEVRAVAERGEYNEFDLGLFFKANKITAPGAPDRYVFEYAEQVQQFLDHLRGQYAVQVEASLRGERAPMPFSDSDLRATLRHTIWYLPSVPSVYAMEALLAKPENKFYHDYDIIAAAGTKAGVGEAALKPVTSAIGDGTQSKTITLTCGKLTTGVSVPGWTGIFMLRNMDSPEAYFQAAFRVQTPWTVTNADGSIAILKHQCFVFDYAPNRALRQIAEYSGRLETSDNRKQEEKVAEFIKFLPVLCYDGFSMTRLNAAQLLDVVATGTGSSMLARRFSSDLMLNVSDLALSQLANSEVLASLEKIEGFRNVGREITTIVAKEASLRQAKAEQGGELTEHQTREKKDIDKKRREIRDNLKKFLTRIPVFMYMTDYREESLSDVIKHHQPALFKKVTGLNVGDFERLVEVGVFNQPAISQAIFQFRRYEDASLNYLGGNQSIRRYIGGFDEKIRAEDLKAMAGGVPTPSDVALRIQEAVDRGQITPRGKGKYGLDGTSIQGCDF